MIRKTYIILTVLSLLAACLAAGSEATNRALAFYIVSESRIDGGRFIDTAAIPKAGYIAPAANLIITNLLDVYPEKSAGFSIMTDTNSNRTVMTNAPRSALAIKLTSEDAKRFAALTEQAVGKRLLLMLGDKPLAAPIVRIPIEDGSMAIEFGREFGGAAEVKKVENDLKNLVRQKPD